MTRQEAIEIIRIFHSGAPENWPGISTRVDWLGVVREAAKVLAEEPEEAAPKEEEKTEIRDYDAQNFRAAKCCGLCRFSDVLRSNSKHFGGVSECEKLLVAVRDVAVCDLFERLES